HDVAAGLGLAGEGHLVHAGVLGQVGAYFGTGAGVDVDDARRDAGVLTNLTEEDGGEGGGAGGLEDYGVAGGQGGGQLPGGHHYGVVPGDNQRADADGLAEGVVEEGVGHRDGAAHDFGGGSREELEVLDGL